jgi:hypothetical protein
MATKRKAPAGGQQDTRKRLLLIGAAAVAGLLVWRYEQSHSGAATKAVSTAAGAGQQTSSGTTGGSVSTPSYEEDIAWGDGSSSPLTGETGATTGSQVAAAAAPAYTVNIDTVAAAAKPAAITGKTVTGAPLTFTRQANGQLVTRSGTKPAARAGYTVKGTGKGNWVLSPTRKK